MKQMRIDPDGTLHCPVCNSSQFAFKRTGKAKLMAGVTVGVGALAAPKRAHCLGCGTDLKPANPKHTTAPTQPGDAQHTDVPTRGRDFTPDNVDPTKNPMMAPTLGEALAIRKARKAAKQATKDTHSTD